MTLDTFTDYVDSSRQHFEEGLIRAGFLEVDAGWEGLIPLAAGTTAVVISLPAGFPFRPPRAVPVDEDAAPWSWHRELDGALCLIAEDDHEDLWWTDASAFLEQVKAWFDQACTGWQHDRPDLDLDRYFHASEDTRLYLYEDHARYRNSFVRFRPSKNATMRIGPGTRPTKSSKHNKDRYGYVADLGEIDVPPRTWDDISARLEPGVDVDRKVRQHAITVLVVLYRRGANDGAIVLEVWPTTTGGIAVRRLRSGADTEAARSARAGLLAPELHSRRVAVVGAGALGSFIADMLVRSGVRHMTLVDDDVVMPGNLVRHLVGPEAVGMAKVDAVRQHLIAHQDIRAEEVNALVQAVTCGDEAFDLLRQNDLVVNATADFATTALLHAAAASVGTHVLSAAMQNRGTTYRIDVLPPLNDAAALPSSTIDVEAEPEDLFEAGCGTPISPTPPHAVIEAAAATVRHAIGLLVGRPLHPSGETRDLLSIPERNRP